MEQKKEGETVENCPKCKSLLRTGSSFYTTENDTTPDLPTIVYVNIPMFCVNKECESYAGEDLNNPKYLIDIVRNQVN